MAGGTLPSGWHHGQPVPAPSPLPLGGVSPHPGDDPGPGQRGLAGTRATGSLLASGARRACRRPFAAGGSDVRPALPCRPGSGGPGSGAGSVRAGLATGDARRARSHGGGRDVIEAVSGGLCLGPLGHVACRACGARCASAAGGTGEGEPGLAQRLLSTGSFHLFHRFTTA